MKFLKNKKTLLLALVLVIGIAITGCVNQTQEQQKIAPQSIGDLEKNQTLKGENASREVQIMFPNITQENGFQKAHFSNYKNNNSKILLYAAIFENPQQASKATVNEKNEFKKGFMFQLNFTKTNINRTTAYTFSHQGAKLAYWSQGKVSYSVINIGAQNLSLSDIIQEVNQA